MAYDRPGGDGWSLGVPRAAFRPSPVFLGLVALFVVSGVMAWNGYGNVRFNVFLFVVVRLAGLALPARVRPRGGRLPGRRPGHRPPGLPDAQPAEVHPPAAVDRAAGGGGAARRHRPARRRGLGRPARHPRPAAAHAWSASPARRPTCCSPWCWWCRSRSAAGRRRAPLEFWAGGGAARRSCSSPRACSTCCRCPGLDGGNMIQPVAQPAVAPDYDHVRPVRASSCSSRCCGTRASAAGSSTRSSPSATLLGPAAPGSRDGLDLIRFWQAESVAGRAGRPGDRRTGRPTRRRSPADGVRAAARATRSSPGPARRSASRTSSIALSRSASSFTPGRLDVVVHLLGPGRADDRRGDVRVLQHPGDGELGHASARPARRAA